MPNAPDYVIVLNNKECDEADTACDNQDRICKQRGLTLIDLGFSNDKDGPRNQKHALRVVCKWAGLVFPMDDAIPQRHPDLGLNIKVRISKCDNPSPPSKFGNLIIRPGDVGSFKYVLVTGHRPNYRIKGWLFGREAPDYGTLEGENTDHPFYLTLRKAS